MSSTRDKVCIVGIGEVAPPHGTDVPSHWGLAAETAARALQDAGLTKKDIDGVVFTTAYGPPFPPPSSTGAYFCEYTGINPVWYENYPYGGMPPGASSLVRAAMGIAAGLATTVLVVNSDNIRSRLSRQGTVETFARQGQDPQYEGPYGTFAMTSFGLIANRHMHEYGTTSEQMAWVAVASRQWAALNPIAEFRTPITVKDVLASKIIASPLHLLDTCPISDGGAAAVVTTGDRAKGLKNTPVWLLGFGEVGIGRYTQAVPDLADINSTKMATARALKMAGVKIEDIDIAYPYDASTIATIFYLEQMGFCKKGEGGSFVEGGRIAPGGVFPVNTHGGLHSCLHNGMSAAFFQVTEAVKQLRGQCGKRQVKDARLAIMVGEGGWFNNSVAILGRI